MKVLLVFLLGAIWAVGAAPDWAEFKLTHGKNYPSANEERLRIEIFRENLKKIDEHNERYEKGLESWRMGVNKFADLTEGEFREFLDRQGRDPFGEKKENRVAFKSKGRSIVDSFDWREKNAVTKVKSQGHCASGWAFAAVGAIESHNFIYNGSLTELSAQQVIDCTRAYYNEGCNGGYMFTVNEYAMDYGLATEENYPYEGVDNKCRYAPEDEAVSIWWYVFVDQWNETAMQEAVAEHGPLTTRIDAIPMQFYEGGVFYAVDCMSDVVRANQGVLIVGFGTTEEGLEYWIVKNSWGELWGEKGYIRMSRNRDNNCGIANEVHYPLIVPPY